MKQLLLPIIFLMGFPYVKGQDDGPKLEVYTGARDGIAAARPTNRLIVFFFGSRRIEEHQKLAKDIEGGLSKLASEFVFVNCETSVKENQILFKDRFKEDFSVLPITVVSSSVGQEIASFQGPELDGYRKMIISARINGGKVTDPIQLSELRSDLEKVGTEDEEPAEIESIFGPMAEDLKRKRIAITEMRLWTKKDGNTFQALLLSAKGAKGEFIGPKGITSEIDFNDLSAADIQVVQQALAKL